MVYQNGARDKRAEGELEVEYNTTQGDTGTKRETTKKSAEVKKNWGIKYLGINNPGWGWTRRG